MDAKRHKKRSPLPGKRNGNFSLNAKLRNLGILATCCTLGALFYIFVSQSDMASAASDQTVSWKDLDLNKEELPQVNVEQVEVKTETIQVKDVQTTVRSAKPPTDVESSGQTLFLLHGAAFTSKTWVDQVPTIQTMAGLGHTVFGIDLPGYGQTPAYAGDKAEYLEAAIKRLCGAEKPVLVSPSMSGSFSLPLLKRNQDLISGFIPVAPVGTGSYDADFYKSIHVPTMIVYGEADYGLGRESRRNLVGIPTSTQPQELAKARHPAYLDQPQKWHQLIFNFLKALKKD